MAFTSVYTVTILVCLVVANVNAWKYNPPKTADEAITVLHTGVERGITFLLGRITRYEKLRNDTSLTPEQQKCIKRWTENLNLKYTSQSNLWLSELVEDILSTENIQKEFEKIFHKVLGSEGYANKLLKDLREELEDIDEACINDD